MVDQTIGAYRIIEPIGEGGMGAVYLAQHERLGRKAAVKVLKPELSRDKEMLRRFFNEARASALVEHPGIVAVHDVGELAGGSAYLIMEYLDGETLADRMRRDGALPLEVILSIGWQVACALGAAHYKGIVHRDLKPANIMLVADYAVRSGWRAKILDFGIAKLSQEKTGNTLSHQVFGTPTYMSPEQLRSAARVDHRTDIYALGCILFEMACGRPPFNGEGLGGVVAGHMTEAPPSPRTLVPAVPAALEQCILRALAKEPDARQQRMSELARELDAVFAGTDAGSLASDFPGQGERGRERAAVEDPTTLNDAASESLARVEPRRPPAWWVAGLAAAVAGVGALVFWLVRPGAPAAPVAAPPPAAVQVAPAAAPVKAAPPGEPPAAPAAPAAAAPAPAAPAPAAAPAAAVDGGAGEAPVADSAGSRRERPRAAARRPGGQRGSVRATRRGPARAPAARPAPRSFDEVEE
jgi:tRNA A-37 threonylcarbamoyl transferase component Bud32